MQSDYDIAIIGAGIAGASLAFALRGRAKTVLIEAEDHPGYHTTGRSAAFYTETYGGSAVRALTTASKAFFFAPPEGFSPTPLVHPRGALHIATQQQAVCINAMLNDYKDYPAIHQLSAAEVYALAPVLKSGRFIGGIYDPDCKDIDVAALHGGYLRGAQKAGITLLKKAPVTALKHNGRCWHITAGEANVRATIIVNAAGAWADAIAGLAGVSTKGLTPMRRTIITFKPAADLYNGALPLVIDIEDRFYFKPEAGLIWASPADETPMPASDVQPDELDIALTAERIEAATRFKIDHVHSTWAGLRTFAPDRAPVFGFDTNTPGFFWCAGQGGFGIQTAPAASDHCASLILER